jgi:hypothetical protein
MAQSAPPEAPQVVGEEYCPGECSPAPPGAELLFGAGGWVERSEPRGRLRAPLWLTSLHKPGIFEVVPTEDVSRFGIRAVTREFWEPGGLVVASSPPGFWVEGSVVYCRQLPSHDYAVGIQLDEPVEHWMEVLGFREASQL